VTLPCLGLVAVSRLALSLVGNVKAGAEHVENLVVLVLYDRLRQRDKVWSERPEALNEDSAPLLPAATAPPQVLRYDPQRSSRSLRAFRRAEARAVVCIRYIYVERNAVSNRQSLRERLR
jgi:hypothetical protein